MPIERLAVDERPGDALTALGKTGLLRSAANAELEALAKHIPPSVYGVPVEYDVFYNRPGGRIPGYKYCDLLASCLWIAPCNAGVAVEHIRATLAKPISAEGVRVFQAIRAHAADKYALFGLHGQSPAILAVMPGSNVLQAKVVDMAKLDAAVSGGAWLKPHPVTHDIDISLMVERYAERVLPKRKQLYPMLGHASLLYGTGHSEVSIASILIDVPYRYLEHDTTTHNGSYTDLLRGMGIYRDNARDRAEKLLHVLSHPECGLVSVFHRDPAAAIDRYFQAMRRYRHVREAGDDA